MLADYLLPVAGGYLRPCAEPGATLTPAPGGHNCNRCARLVHDFTDATAADVAQARAAAPDGRLCGRFRVERPALVPGFSRRLRCFMVVLVLIVGRGLTAQEALAQVRPAPPAIPSQNIVYGIAEQMPSYKGGQMIDLAKAIQKQFRYSPVGKQKPTGKVYVAFQVDAHGKVRDIKVLKGSTALVDSAAIQAIRNLEDFEPGTQNGRPVPVGYTIPIQYVKPD